MIFILTGTVNSGKTTTLDRWITEYRSEGIQPRGILSPAIFRGGKKISYDVWDLGSDARLPLASEEALEKGERFGRFRFFERGLQLGRQAISKLDEKTKLGVVDEVGPLELAGGGWSDSLRTAISLPPEKLILVVRSHLVDEVAEYFGIDRFQVLTTDSDRP